MANNVNVTNRGFEYMCQWMANTAGTNTPYTSYTIPTYIGWGTANGSNATSVQLPATGPVQSFPGNISTAGTGQWSDVAPYFELTESRTQGTATVINNVAAGSYSTMQVVGTITASAAESVGESFLSFSATKNAATSIATNNVVSGATSMTVASHTGFPGSGNYYVQVDNEVMEVTAGQGTNTWTIARAQNGSAQPSTHLVNTGVTLGNIPGAGTANPNNADMFAHAGFVALALNIGDSVAFTWSVNVTS